MLALLLLLVTWKAQVLAATYTAAVVEHAPVYSTERVNRSEALAIMQRNLDRYAEDVAKAVAESGDAVDIMLFPEDGLYGAAFYTRDSIYPYLEPLPAVPSSPSAAVVPCVDFTTAQRAESPVIVRTSCLARSFGIALVLDMGEVSYCEGSPGCPSDGRLQFNTLVVLGPKGEFLSKYHKSHLYYEPQFNEPLYPKPTTVDIPLLRAGVTVRFGLMICFDVMFYEPQETLAQRMHVTDLLFSSWWVNEPPLINGVPMQWAHSSSVFSGNFLASGIGLSWQQSGSGIYSNGSLLNSTYNDGNEPQEQVVIATLPVLSTVSAFDQPPSHEHEPPSHELSTLGRHSLGGRGSRNTDSRGDERAQQAFLSSPCASGGLNVSIGDMKCEAFYEVSCDNPGEPQWFGLLAIFGKYNGLFDARICSLMRCAMSEDSSVVCGDPAMDTHTSFSSWNVTLSTTAPVPLTYDMVMIDDGFTASESSFESSSDFKTMRSGSEWRQQALLGATVFGVVRNG